MMIMMMRKIFIDYIKLQRSTIRDAWRSLIVLFVSNEGKDSCLHLNALFRGYGIKKLKKQHRHTVHTVTQLHRRICYYTHRISPFGLVIRFSFQIRKQFFDLNTDSQCPT